MLTEKENLKRLNERISNLDLKGNLVVAFDFDELVVPIHLTKVITRKIAKPVDLEILKKKSPVSFDGLIYLNDLLVGCDYKEYRKIRSQVSKETKWAEGFESLIKDLAAKYTVIFISSGLKDICETKLNEIGFNSHNILASELKIENNQITGSDLVISDNLKGFIITELRKNNKVISVGHSLGDRIMLDKSDIGIAFKSDIPSLGDYHVNSTKEISDIIKTAKVPTQN
jgi:phosphoserine phosphatase